MFLKDISESCPEWVRARKFIRWTYLTKFTLGESMGKPLGKDEWWRFLILPKMFNYIHRCITHVIVANSDIWMGSLRKLLLIVLSGMTWGLECSSVELVTLNLLQMSQRECLREGYMIESREHQVRSINTLKTANQGFHI